MFQILPWFVPLTLLNITLGMILQTNISISIYFKIGFNVKSVLYKDFLKKWVDFSINLQI